MLTSSLVVGGRTRGVALCCALGLSGAMLCVLDASPALAAPVYTISPFAGTGTAGPPTAGPALSSELHNPDQVAVGSNGDVYIADQSNYEVEQVTPSGALSIIAGTGTRNPPTPGPATSSHLTNPAGLAVDSAGNVYISDENSGEVVMVTPSGMLSIIAGTGTQGTPTPGPATSSELGSPEGLALDAGGDLYIADNVNREVLEVTPSGTLSIVAGTGASGTPAPGPATSSPLGSPDGLAVDASGNLYIADADGYVEKVTPSGTLSIIAGNGNYGNPTPGPARSSDLGEPYGIAVDAAGNVDIADGIDIEQVSPDGTLSVIAGNNSYGAPSYGGPAASSALNAPNGVATTPAGHVYIADTGNATIDQIAPDAPVNLTVPTNTGAATTGQTLTAGQGTWTNDPIIYSYQWQDCDSTGANCTTIAGATATTYTLTTSDAGHTVRVVVTAQNGGGSTAADSAASGLVPGSPVTPTTPTTTSTTQTTPTPAASPVDGCPAATGRLSGGTLGLLKLGMTRARAIARYAESSSNNKPTWQFFCLTPRIVRAGFPSPQLLNTLTTTEQNKVRGRIVIALTANHYYNLKGVRSGTSLTTAAHKLHTGPVFHVGKNDWYMAPNGHTTAIIKVRHGTVEEIGTANKHLTRDRATQRTFITSFSS